MCKIIKMEKNYFRDYLLELIKQTDGKPILVSGRYKQNKDPYCKNSFWECFTTIRPYIPGYHTKTICSHINFPCHILKKYFDFTEKYNNKRFYIIGYPSVYFYKNIKRGCIRLAENLDINPIIPTEEKELIKQASKICYQFDYSWIRDSEIEKYNIKHTKQLP